MSAQRPDNRAGRKAMSNKDEATPAPVHRLFGRHFNTILAALRLSEAHHFADCKPEYGTMGCPVCDALKDVESLKCAVNGCNNFGAVQMENGLRSCDCGLHMVLVSKMLPPDSPVMRTAKLTGLDGQPYNQ